MRRQLLQPPNVWVKPEKIKDPTYEVHGEGPPVVQLPLQEKAEGSGAFEDICCCGSARTDQRLVGRQHAAVALVSSDGNQRHGAKLLLGDV